VAIALTGCSGGGSTATPAPASSGPCDSEALAQYAGSAAGAVGTYVWKPYQAGAFKPDAAGRKAALALGAAAAARAATDLRAIGQVEGCATSLSLTNALRTGASLASSVGGQLAAGTVNPEALGGLNSAVGTVVQQAEETGVKVTVTAPTVAELTKG
jgi:hypothetical protein